MSGTNSMSELHFMHRQVKTSDQSVYWNEGECRLCVNNKSLSLSWSEATGSSLVTAL